MGEAPPVYKSTEQKVFEWRYETCLHLGLSHEIAFQIGQDRLVDLAMVRRMHRSGCSVELMERILG